MLLIKGNKDAPGPSGSSMNMYYISNSLALRKRVVISTRRLHVSQSQAHERKYYCIRTRASVAGQCATNQLNPGRLSARVRPFEKEPARERSRQSRAGRYWRLHALRLVPNSVSGLLILVLFRRQ